ncbi:hypothetical protein CCR98_03250 [Stenotrophomonas sp. WZN-1]|nr:hypothetical protein CCR98_03250 [Stenotrophomonas sp. WZN-1]
MLPMRIVGNFESVGISWLAGSGEHRLPNATFFAARIVESSALHHFVDVASASVAGWQAVCWSMSHKNGRDVLLQLHPTDDGRLVLIYVK